MLYPRETKSGQLVTDEQMVCYREHLTQQYRVLFLSGIIGKSCGVCGQGELEGQNLLLALDSLSHKPIKLIITSPGGDVDSAFLFYDTIKLIKSPVITIGRYCASAAAMLLAAGQKRYVLPHAKVMLHLVSGSMVGDAREWEIQHKQLQGYMNKMVDILLECGVKRTRAEVMRDIDRDFWLEPEEAIEYGLADAILDKKTLGGWLS